MMSNPGSPVMSEIDARQIRDIVTKSTNTCNRFYLSI